MKSDKSFQKMVVHPGRSDDRPTSLLGRFSKNIRQFASKFGVNPPSFFWDRLRRMIPFPPACLYEGPIFIIGSSRSGTSILIKVLGQLDGISTFSENWLVREHMWRMLYQPQSLSTEVGKLKRTLARLSERSFEELLVEKTPGHSMVAEILARNFKHAKFLHIVRDGRDAASSMLGHPWIASELKGHHAGFWWHYLPWHYRERWAELTIWEKAVLRWALYVSMARQAAWRRGNYYELYYDEFCTNPEYVLRQILAFLDVPFREEARSVVKGVHSGSIGRWRDYGPSKAEREFYLKAVSYFRLTDLHSRAEVEDGACR